jgi:16S rRNA (guanine966-N2)-methyltransferase
MRVIAGEWRGRRLQAPPGRATRPTTDRVREAWMSVVGPELPDATVLDLFAGSGALGIEALSRGAAHAVFVEQSAPAIRALRTNLDALGAGDRARIVRSDAIRFVDALEPLAFDVAFADPPYGTGLASRIADRFAERPFARLLCLEHGEGDELPDLADARVRRYGSTFVTFVPASV